MKAVLEVKKLSKRFKKHEVLKATSFCIHEGEIVGFVGENGVGKSTAMKCICSLVFPDTGDVIICVHDIKKQPIQAMKCIFVLIKSPGLYTSMTGVENSMLNGKLLHCSQERIQVTIDIIHGTALIVRL